MYGDFKNPNDFWRERDEGYHEDQIMIKNLKRILMFIGILAVIVLATFLLTSCRSKKAGVNESTNVSDSVKIEYREKIVKVPVTVYVEVPVESKVQIDRDSSHLETSFAVSEAKMVWIDGVLFLRHSLDNKPQKIQKQDSIPVTEKEKIVWKTRRVTYNRTEIREKQLSWWQSAKILLGGWSLLLNALFIGIIIWKRKKVFSIII